MRLSYSFWGILTFGFFAENQQISFADHDFEIIIRWKPVYLETAVLDVTPKMSFTIFS